MSILRYVLVDRNDQESDYEYANYDDAKREASKLGSAVIMRTYEYDDSELVWTPDDSNFWPPKH